MDIPYLCLLLFNFAVFTSYYILYKHYNHIVAAECTRRIVAIEGAVKAICSRLLTVDPNNRTSKDLAEQCIKVSIVQ